MLSVRLREPGFGHRHADDLSFVMHGLGRWWILEGGKHSYDPGPVKDFLRSPQAHNGVTFDGEALGPLDRKDSSKNVKVDERLIATPQLAAARAWTTRFHVDGVRVTRTYVFLRDRSTLILLDQYESPRSGSWQSRVHLAPDAEYAVERDGVLVRVPTHPQARLDVVFEDEGLSSLKVIKGQEEPLMGWHSPKFQELLPTPVIVAERNGSGGVFANVVRLHEDQSAPRPQGLTATLIENGSAARITWTEGEDQIRLRIALNPHFAVQQE